MLQHCKNISGAARAFSLVELSIVLVILGLLVGGILSGQSLIRAAELRKTTSDISKIKTALYTFRDKYMGLPGDLANASSFWGAADGNDGLGSDCYTATATGTCNGNGDGQIWIGPEQYRMWQQLILAGLWTGTVSGVPGTPPYSNYANDVVGTNLPRSPLNPSAAYTVSYFWTNMGYPGFAKQNTLIISPCCWSDGSSRATIEGSSILATDMWNIDTKLDDGVPGTGFIQIYAGYGCVLSASQYDLSASNPKCQPIIGMGI